MLTDGWEVLLGMRHLKVFSLAPETGGRALKTALRTAGVFPEGILLAHTRQETYRPKKDTKIAQLAGVRPLKGVFMHREISMAQAERWSQEGRAE